MLNTLPIQKNTVAEKLKVEKGDTVPKWIKANGEFFGSFRGRDIDHKYEMTELYDTVSGKIVKGDFKYVENPLDAKEDKNKRYPAQLRNYNIIRPVIDSYIGDLRSSGNRYRVAPIGEEYSSEREQKEIELFKKWLQQKTVNEINNTMETGVESQEMEDPKDYVESNLDTWDELRAYTGKAALDFIVRDQDIKNKFALGFYDWLTVGRVASYKDIVQDDVLEEIVSPLDITVIGADDTSRYGEDAFAIVREQRLSTSSIIDLWREHLSEEQIKMIEERGREYGQYNDVTRMNDKWAFGQDINYVLKDDGLHVVEHCTWKTLVNKRILRFVDDLGQSAEMEVDETYVLNPDAGDIEIYNEWQNEVWEYRRIVGQNEKDAIYIHWGPHMVQRQEVNNTSKCKLPYNVVAYSHRDNQVYSIAKIGKPYQDLYNIYHYRFELTLAKNKDKVMLFPLSLIPSKKGWNTESWMHKIHAFSIAFFDDTKPNALAALQAIKDIDLSLSQYMKDMYFFYELY
jgi:hypothetical protein